MLASAFLNRIGVERMEFYYPKAQVEKYQPIVENSLFLPLVDYMLENSQKQVILRELKKQIPEKGLEKLIDKMIETGLMKREERRYLLNFPVYKSVSKKIVQESAEKVADKLRQLAPDKQLLFLGEKLWTYCFESSDDYFYATSLERYFYEKREAGNDTLRFITISQREKWSKTLPNYFVLQKKQREIPQGLMEVATLLGDVNESYYFDQVEMLIERAQVGKLKSKRPNIFLDSLLKMQILTKEEEQFRLQVPLIEQSEGVEVTLPNIETQENDETKGIFLRHFFYEAILDLLDLEEFSYILKN